MVAFRAVLIASDEHFTSSASSISRVEQPKAALLLFFIVESGRPKDTPTSNPEKKTSKKSLSKWECLGVKLPHGVGIKST
jgi:hypothetical protein